MVVKKNAGVWGAGIRGHGDRALLLSKRARARRNVLSLSGPARGGKVARKRHGRRGNHGRQEHSSSPHDRLLPVKKGPATRITAAGLQPSRPIPHQTSETAGRERRTSATALLAGRAAGRRRGRARRARGTRAARAGVAARLALRAARGRRARAGLVEAFLGHGGARRVLRFVAARVVLRHLGLVLGARGHAVGGFGGSRLRRRSRGGIARLLLLGAIAEGEGGRAGKRDEGGEYQGRCGLAHLVLLVDGW